MRDLVDAFYVVVSPEWTTKCHVIRQDAIDQPKEPGSTHTDLLSYAHDLGIAEQVADSNIMIIGHKNQEEAFSHTSTKTQIETSGSSKRQRRECGS